MIKKYQKTGKKLHFKNILGKFGVVNVLLIDSLYLIFLYYYG